MSWDMREWRAEGVRGESRLFLIDWLRLSRERRDEDGNDDDYDGILCELQEWHIDDFLFFYLLFFYQENFAMEALFIAQDAIQHWNDGGQHHVVTERMILVEAGWLVSIWTDTNSRTEEQGPQVSVEP